MSDIHELNARRLLCPLPVIRTQERIKELSTGDLLRVVCTDPGVKHDIPAWCRLHGHEVISLEDEDSQITLTIKVLTA